MPSMTPPVRPARELDGPEDLAEESPAFAIGLDRAQACATAGMPEGDAHAITTLPWTAAPMSRGSWTGRSTGRGPRGSRRSRSGVADAHPESVDRRHGARHGGLARTTRERGRRSARTKRPSASYRCAKPPPVERSTLPVPTCRGLCGRERPGRAWRPAGRHERPSASGARRPSATSRDRDGCRRPETSHTPTGPRLSQAACAMGSRPGRFLRRAEPYRIVPAFGAGIVRVDPTTSFMDDQP